MLIANKRIAQGRGLAAALLKRAATIELDWDTRSKTRFDATDSSGRRLGPSRRAPDAADPRGPGPLERRA